MAASPGKWARDWQLANMSEMPARVLIEGPDDRLGRFFLGLSLAFNDLKGLVLFERMHLEHGRPPTGMFNEYSGQWRGVHLQLSRWLAGTLHEIMTLLWKHRDVVDGEKMEALVAPLSPAVKSAWANIVAIALKRSTSARRQDDALRRIRNNVAFHYYDPKVLAQGFDRHFIDQTDALGNPENRAPFYSLGPDMDGTRFFYADAAAQGAMFDLGEQYDFARADTRVAELAGEVNQAIAPVLAAFLESRASQSKTAPPPIDGPPA